MSFESAPQVYNPQWPEIFKQEAARLSETCPYITLHHIGSTAVAGLQAKPIIDILIEVMPGSLNDLTRLFVDLGYLSKCEYGIKGRSYFTKPSQFHVHAFENENSEIVKHLAFRDYLRSHSIAKKSYGDLKEKIISTPNITRDEYQNRKNDFLISTTAQALAWYAKVYPIQTVRKAVIYVLRRQNSEVLVFDQVKYPEVNPQVPSGTIETHESILLGATRELFEESGILVRNELKFLGSYEFYKPHLNQMQERNIFYFDGSQLKETWIHSVTGTGVDQNLEFLYYWIPMTEAKRKLQVNLGDGLEFFL